MTSFDNQQPSHPRFIVASNDSERDVGKSYPLLSLVGIVDTTHPCQTIQNASLQGVWYGDYGVVDVMKMEGLKTICVFVPPRHCIKGEWEEGYEGYVMEGTVCTKDEMELHRIYQHASPSNRIEFRSKSSCVLHTQFSSTEYAVTDIASIIPSLNRGWPLSLIMESLSPPENEKEEPPTPNRDIVLLEFPSLFHIEVVHEQQSKARVKHPFDHSFESPPTAFHTTSGCATRGTTKRKTQELMSARPLFVPIWLKLTPTPKERRLHRAD